MPPKEDGTPKAFTWITGNPRSKKNLTQIRRHAGQSSAVRAETKSPVQEPGGSLEPSSARDQFVASKETAQPSAIVPSSPALPIRPSSAAAVADGSSLASQHTIQNTAKVEPGCSIANPGQGKDRPHREDLTRPRKLTIWDLVNHSEEEEEDGHITEASASTLLRDAEQEVKAGEEPVLEDQGVLKAPINPRGRSLRGQQRTTSYESSAAISAHISKRRRPVGRGPSSSWRVGMAPSAVRFLSNGESRIVEFLSQTSAFYNGKFDTSWSRQLRESQIAFDIVTDLETFSGSVATAAALISVGRVDTASATLGRVLPTLHRLLVSQHPQLYYILADLSLDTSDTELGRLRGQVKQYTAGISQTTLGPSHPITRLLQVDLPQEQKRRLRELIQRKVHDLHEQLFSATSYQTSGHYYYFARMLAQLGRTDEAAQILSTLIRNWDARHGSNNLMSVTGLLELGKIYLAQHQERHYAEQLISDALRRTESIGEHGSRRPHSLGIVHSHMGCLRTLGLLHTLRNNHDAAVHHYTQAVAMGIDELGSSVPAVQLALADLDAATKARARAILSAEQPDAAGPSRGDFMTSLTSISNVAVQ